MKKTIDVHFNGNVYKIRDKDVEDYNLMTFLNDCVAYSLADHSGQIGEVPYLEGVVPRSNETIPLLSDDDLATFFNMYADLDETIIHTNLEYLSPNETRAEPQNYDETFDWSDNDSIREGNEIDKDHEIEDVVSDQEDSGDELSAYGSSDAEQIHCDSEDNEQSLMAKLCDRMVGNYFQPIGGKIEFEVGQTFDNVTHFRQILRDYVIQEDYPIDRIHNDKKRVTVRCKRTSGCTWRIHSSPVSGDQTTFQIKSYNPDHTCDPFGASTKEATSNWIADKMVDEFEANPFTDVNTLAGKLAKKYGVKVKTNRLYRARQLCRDMISGDHKGSYAKIPSYINILRQRNPGVMDNESDEHDQRDAN